MKKRDIYKHSDHSGAKFDPTEINRVGLGTRIGLTYALCTIYTLTYTNRKFKILFFIL